MPRSGFSPRNGESVLKDKSPKTAKDTGSFSPRNGESVLKSSLLSSYRRLLQCFSPRNGESVLKIWRKKMPNRGKYTCFSPRNGESVLKFDIGDVNVTIYQFQSPQWGKCSKGRRRICPERQRAGFSPRNGESVLKPRILLSSLINSSVSVPAMGKVF